MNRAKDIRVSFRRLDEAAVPYTRNVFIVAGSVLVMVAFCLGAAAAMLRLESRGRPMQSMAPLGILTSPDNAPLTHLPAPTLDLDDGHADFMALSGGAKERLNSYGWVDRTNGIVNIPIERAMDLIAARGLPTGTTRATPTASSQLPPKRGEKPP
jgi:hypothetical protein